MTLDGNLLKKDYFTKYDKAQLTLIPSPCLLRSTSKEKQGIAQEWS